MIDIAKFYARLDALDPRINPIIPDATGAKSRAEILKLLLNRTEILMSVLDNRPDNLLRLKGAGIIQAIQAERSKPAVEALRQVLAQTANHINDRLPKCKTS